MSQWIQVEAHQGKKHSASLVTDLSDYINAYHNGKQKTDLALREHAQQSYKKYYNELVTELSGLNGYLLWENMIIQATQGLDATVCEQINNCPISTFMQNSFVEIVKNTLDEAILGGNPKATLTLSIDLSKMPDNISMSFSDTGRGYPTTFIQKLMNAKGREQYILEHGSPKHLEHKENMLPALFGGKGRGLRMLLANIEYGDELIKNGILQKRYEKPECSEIYFSNMKDNQTHNNGALMIITTSVAPLQDYIKSLTKNVQPTVPNTINNAKGLYIDIEQDDVSESLTDNEFSDEEPMNMKSKSSKNSLYLEIDDQLSESHTDNDSDNEDKRSKEWQKNKRDLLHASAGSFSPDSQIKKQTTNFHSFKNKFTKAIEDSKNYLTSEVDDDDYTCR